MKPNGVIAAIYKARLPPPDSDFALDGKFLEEITGKQAYADPLIADHNQKALTMNINETFPSKYLKASDIEWEAQATISNVEIEDIGQDDKKPIVYFHGWDKGIVLNKTNANNIAAAYGPETDHWIGKDVVIYTAWVDFQGRSVEAIRVRPARKPTQQAKYPPRTSQQVSGGVSNAPDAEDPGWQPDQGRA